MLTLLPGLICDKRIYAAQAAAFPDALVVDSYGLADSLARMARVALDAADERGVHRLDVLGHSMGGRVALELYRIAPERVRRLALVSTGIHPPTPDEAKQRAALQRVGRERGFEALVDEWLPPMVAEDCREDPSVYPEIWEMCVSMGQEVFDAQVRALLARPSAGDLLATIPCPALVMTGEHDRWSPPEQHEAIAAAIPGARLVIVPGAGHMIPMEAPAAVNHAIADWLARPAD